MPNLYSIRDLKADAFATPFLFPNDLVAMRAVQEAASAPDTSLAKHPGDYQLWCLGSYDEPTGVINSVPVLVCNVTSILNQSAATVEVI